MAPIILTSFVLLLGTVGETVSLTEGPTSITCQALVNRLDALEQIVTQQARDLQRHSAEVTTLKRQLHERETQLDQLRELLRAQKLESISLRRQVAGLLPLQQTYVNGPENNGIQDLTSEEDQAAVLQPNHHEDDSYPLTTQANSRPLQKGSSAALSGPARHGGAIIKSKAHRRSDDLGPLEATVSQLSQQVTLMQADLLALHNSDQQHSQDILSARQSVFVRWGNSQCTNVSQRVYAGVVGGSYYTDPGAATNFLCLTLNPVFGEPKSSAIAHLYGAEYETHDSHFEKNPVCAVCRAPLATTVMIPGTDACSPGWVLQYSGYLMAGAASHSAGTEYVCVDFAMDNTMNGDANEEGKLLYYTATRCGSLPCSPYVNDKTVLCAVCSK